MLVGATGLVGSHVLKQALDNENISHITVLSRRAIELEQNPKLQCIEVDFEQLDENADWWKVDSVICTLGTTIEKAQSKNNFRRVDHDYPVAVANIARKHGAQCYVVNSAMGANSQSSIFYNKVKGELEQSLVAINYPSLYLIKPGFIHGKRPEKRLSEQIIVNVLLMFAPIIPKKFRVNSAHNIAKSMISSALKQAQGITTITSKMLA